MEARLQETIGEVNVFSIHEIVFIKAFHFQQFFSLAEHECPRNDVDGRELGEVKELHVVVPEQSGLRKEVPESCHSAKSRPGRGESASRLFGKRPVGLEHFDTEDACLGMRFRRLKHFVQGVLGQNGVGIQEEDVFSGDLMQSLVVGASEAQILTVGNDFHTEWERGGETVAQMGDGVVGGVVVHHEDFHFFKRNSL